MIRRVIVSLTAALALGTAVAVPMALATSSVASAQSATSCPGKKGIYYKFQYNFGRGSDVTDEGCATSNNVTKADNPDLIATLLHVSCSDRISADGVPTKSDLGDPARRIVFYFISKDGGKKTCGQGTTTVPSGGVLGEGLLFGASAAMLLGGGYVVSRKRTNRASTPLSV
jgi:hypothetical protein